MTDRRYDIVFRGDILPGHQLLEVKERLGQLFKSGQAEIQALFTGGVVILKRNLDSSSAERYKTALARAGADCQVAETGSVRATAARRPQAARRRSARSTADAVQPVAAAQRQSQAGESNPWSTLPAGSDLLRPEERSARPAVEVDVSYMTLRPQQGNLIDESERSKRDPVAVGASNFELSELGSDLLREDERAKAVAGDVKIPDVGLAPTGSDLGQLKDDSPPLPPDVSRLSLTDPDV